VTTNEALVELTPLRDEDSDALFRWINDRETVELSAVFRPVARGDHDAWFEDVRGRPDVEIYAIRAAGALVGSCQLHAIDRVEGSAELQIRIGEADARGRGIGTAAVRLLLARAFDGLGLERVRLHVFETNERAIATYVNSGFVETGRHGGRVEMEARRPG
jgi:RimJ/RimL family protein N-acetyltransferase